MKKAALDEQLAAPTDRRRLGSGDRAGLLLRKKKVEPGYRKRV
jgi:hypothetical protein